MLDKNNLVLSKAAALYKSAESDTLPACNRKAMCKAAAGCSSLVMYKYCRAEVCSKLECCKLAGCNKQESYNLCLLFHC